VTLPHQPAVLAAAVAVVVAALGWWTVPRLPTNPDECWPLVVVRRVRAGRRLYRGVFFGAGPWSVWVDRLLVRWWGERLLVMRRAVVVLSVAVAGAAWAWTAALGAPPYAGLTVAAGAVLMSTALWTSDNHYGLWSRVGVLVALAAPLGIDTPWMAAALGGTGLALALLNKYTLGLAAVPGVLAAGELSAVWAVGVAAVLVVAGYGVAARGGVGPSIVQRLLHNKRTFVATGGSGFVSAWRTMLHRPPDQSLKEVRLTWGAYALTVLAAGLVAADLVASVVGDRAVSWPVLGLVVVALAALWPRADGVHVRCSLPLWTAPGLVAADRLAPSLAVAWAVLLGLAGGVSAVVAVVERRGTRLPDATGTPFAGVNPWPWDLAEVLGGGEELRGLTRGTVLLLRPDAAVWYLATGLRNPTPYDYPLASPFGPDGQQVLVENLRNGRVRYCCWKPADAGALTPVVLEEYVASLPVLATTRAGTLVSAR
jgi:hypothetical protein